MQGTPQQLPGASFPAGTAAPLSFHGDIQITASAQPGKRTTASIQAPSMSIPESSSAHDRDTYIKKLETSMKAIRSRQPMPPSSLMSHNNQMGEREHLVEELYHHLPKRGGSTHPSEPSPATGGGVFEIERVPLVLALEADAGAHAAPPPPSPAPSPLPTSSLSRAHVHSPPPASSKPTTDAFARARCMSTGTGAASAGARDDDDDDEGGFAYHERTLWDSVVHTGHLFWRWARFMCLDDCYACSARGVRLVTTGSSHAAYQPMAATTDQGDFESAL